MTKVAILGSENSHAWHFAAALSDKDGSRLYQDIELIGVYGDISREDGRKGNEEIAKVSSCPHFAGHYDDFLSEADAVMVTARHGDNHLKYAYKYIEKGIPVWIDKPITANEADAAALAALAKKHRAPICGGSSLVHTDEIKRLCAYVKENRADVLGGHVTAPVNLENDYGGFWFYSQHLVQMITAVFGIDVKSVTAKRENNSVRAVYRFEDFCVTAFFGTGYTASVYKSGYDAVSCNIHLGDDYFLPELNDFYQMIKTGRGVADFREFIAPVILIGATKRAFEENRETAVTIPEV